MYKCQISVLLLGCLLACDKPKTNSVAIDMSPPPTSTIEAHQNPPAKTVYKLLPVYASRLWRDYEENEVRADQQYKFADNGGIGLFVKGYVADIGKDLFGHPYLSLRTPNMFLGVRAEISEKWAAKVNKADFVYMWCGGGGKMMIPVIQHCAVVYWSDSENDRDAIHELLENNANPTFDFSFELVETSFRK